MQLPGPGVRIKRAAQRRDLFVRLLSSTAIPGHAAAMRSLFETTVPSCLASSRSRSSARDPSATGIPFPVGSRRKRPCRVSLRPLKRTSSSMRLSVNVSWRERSVGRVLRLPARDPQCSEIFGSFRKRHRAMKGILYRCKWRGFPMSIPRSGMMRRHVMTGALGTLTYLNSGGRPIHAAPGTTPVVIRYLNDAGYVPGFEIADALGFFKDTEVRIQLEGNSPGGPESLAAWRQARLT